MHTLIAVEPKFCMQLSLFAYVQIPGCSEEIPESYIVVAVVVISEIC